MNEKPLAQDLFERGTRLIAAFSLLLMMLPAGLARADDTGFQTWLASFRQEALARGISARTLDAALGDVQPLEKVLELDRRQPEFVDTFWNYLDKRVNDWRLDKGQGLRREHHVLLDSIQEHYNVPARFLLAFWGLETNFGANMGDHPIPAALATLAYDNRRSDFFRNELLQALRIIDAGHVSADRMRGSWAGAMGQMQFMPSTFMRYAVDADGDGRKDIWNSLPDALASAANYINAMGWRDGETWGREVRLPPNFDWRLAGLNVHKYLAEWSALGVTQADGRRLPRADIKGSILAPQGVDGPAMLVYRNFDVILGWNRSINYALAVGHLADRLVGLPPLRNGRQADNRRMTLDQAIELQLRLTELGFNPGAADGVFGSRTRAAIRDYQLRNGLPGDGHGSLGLLERLQADTPSLVLTPRNGSLLQPGPAAPKAG